MKRWIRVSIGVATVLVLAAGAVIGFAVLRADSRMARVVEVPARDVSPRTDAEGVARGRYLYESRGCTDCHGLDGAGRVFIDDTAIGMRVAGSNLTRGPGSGVLDFQPADWDRAIRHGVRRDGRPLLVMPSEDFNRWTDADLGAVVGYLLQLPPRAGGRGEVRLPLPVKALYGLGRITDAAAKIDHALPVQVPVPEAVTLDHGEYVAQGCKGCHGGLLAGGRVPGAPPDWPPAANLTPGQGSAMSRYPDAGAFRAMMRSGKRPDGSTISAVMPFEALARTSDVDLDALYLYLGSLPARPVGQR